jgi:hypothetical protein
MLLDALSKAKNLMIYLNEDGHDSLFEQINPKAIIYLSYEASTGTFYSASKNSKVPNPEKTVPLSANSNSHFANQNNSGTNTNNPPTTAPSQNQSVLLPMG